MAGLPAGFQLEGAKPPPISIVVHGGANSPPPAQPSALPPGFQLESPTTAQAAPQSIGDQLSAGFTSGVRAVPFVGPSMLTGLEHLKAAVQGRPVEDVAATDQAQTESNPVASTIGTVAGNVLPFVAGGEIPAVAKVLGMDAAMPLLARTLLSGGTQAAITGGDELLRGTDPRQAAMDAAMAGGIGLVAPGAGDVIGKLFGLAGKKAGQVVDTLTNPDRAAEKITAGAMAQDIKTGNPGMSAADEASAALNGQPVLNADRYGPNVRTLARTAANADPTAEAVLKDATGDRFLTQAQRAVDFVKRVTGSVDDMALREQIINAARQSNRGAYAKAYGAPAAQAVWSPELAQLFQSPSFRKAVQDATATAAEDAAVTGGKAGRNPFLFDANGAPSLRVNADGSKAIPNLQFWDIVQRNLRQAAESMAGREGMKMTAGQIGDVRAKLLQILDGKVPLFAKARAGAAAAFGAEDALDAGRKFVSQKMGIPEARKAYAQFTPAERKAFATGFASELIDKINSVSDRVNVINQMFASPAARAQVELALGKNAAAQLEHFVRIEDIMQMTKDVVGGNSSTAKQLIASGILGGGIGGAMSGWDPREMATGAFFLTAGRAGLRAMGKSMDQKVMQRVAQMLVSNDPQMMTKATQSAAWSPVMRDAVEAIERGLHSIVKGETVGAFQPQPAQITVRGGSSPSTASAP